MGAVQGIMRSLRAYLEGDWGECCRAITVAESTMQRDPEVLFYAARQLARIQETERALSALSNAIDRGFLCVSALSRDPWLEPLRACPGYDALKHKAERLQIDIHTAFMAAGGEELIGIG
jgi:hypothetical protein